MTSKLFCDGIWFLLFSFELFVHKERFAFTIRFFVFLYILRWEAPANDIESYIPTILMLDHFHPHFNDKLRTSPQYVPHIYALALFDDRLKTLS